jgi:transcriptional regulator with XRE-family HTH domain
MEPKSKGVRLKQIRKALFLSQDEFAARMGVKQSHVSAAERAVVGPNKKPVWFSLGKLQKLSAECGVNLGWLETGEGEMFAGIKPIAHPDLTHTPNGLAMNDKFIIEWGPDLDYSRPMYTIEEAMAIAADLLKAGDQVLIKPIIL